MPLLQASHSTKVVQITFQGIIQVFCSGIKYIPFRWNWRSMLPELLLPVHVHGNHQRMLTYKVAPL